MESFGDRFEVETLADWRDRTVCKKIDLGKSIWESSEDAFLNLHVDRGSGSR